MRAWVGWIWLIGQVVLASIGFAQGASMEKGDGDAMQIDHVILAVDDLESGIREFETHTGVKPTYGGSHPDRDTHNAIAPLPGGMYVEILAPKDGLEVMPEFFEELHQLTLVGFAISTPDIEGVEKSVRALGLETHGTQKGSRTTPGGGELAWRLLLINNPEVFMNPFFISWSDHSEHPSIGQPPQAELERLELTTPHKEQIEQIQSENGGEIRALALKKGPLHLTLDLKTPKGRITYTSATGRAAHAESACPPTDGGHPVFESCEAWNFPFGSHAEWLDFMAEGTSADETAALAQAWGDEEFNGWLSGRRGSIARVTFRSESLLLRGLIVRPIGVGSFPGVVYARGGNREWGRLRFLDVIRMLTIAETGRVVLALEYRGEGGSEGEPELGAGDVTDVRSAAAALDALPFIDTEQLDVVGFSRGGLVAAWALEPPTPFRSAVLIAADLDLVDTASRRPPMDSEVYRLSVPGYSEDREAALRSHSPVHSTDRLADVPILLLHGADDARVHPSASLRFATRWTEAGRTARVVVFESGGHALLSHSPAVRAELESWFSQRISPQAPSAHLEETDD